MAILKQPARDSFQERVLPLTPFEMYLARINSVTENLRNQAAGFDYYPLQFGGLIGQRQSLLANSAVRLVSFKVTGDNK